MWIREVIPKKSCILKDIVQKGGGGEGGVQPESKSFGGVFWGVFLDITKERGGGFEHIPKVLG